MMKHLTILIFKLLAMLDLWHGMIYKNYKIRKNRQMKNYYLQYGIQEEREFVAYCKMKIKNKQNCF